MCEFKRHGDNFVSVANSANSAVLDCGLAGAAIAFGVVREMRIDNCAFYAIWGVRGAFENSLVLNASNSVAENNANSVSLDFVFWR